MVATLAASPVVVVVDTPVPVDDRPLVLWGRRLYTQRQWADECCVGEALRQRRWRPSRWPPDDVLARLAGIGSTSVSVRRSSRC